jgi:hypothetical protein
VSPRGPTLLLTLTACGHSSTAGAPPADAAPADDASAECLPAFEADLLSFVAALPFAPSSGKPAMAPVAVGAPAWRAAHDAAVAWAAGDCAAFRTSAAAMGYQARVLRDRATGRRHWLLTDEGARYDGVFLFRDPAERAGARPLVIDSPHFGFDFRDQRALQAYRDLDAVAFLQNTAHRCNLAACSGCTLITSYPCDCPGTLHGPRTSDVVHSVDQLYYAVYDGLEEARDDVHFEYHGAGSEAQLSGCAGTVHMSQGTSQALSAAEDDGTFPSRFWRAMAARLGEECVCYHQREKGCQLNGAGSTPARRTNREAGGDPGDLCTTAPPRLAGRFVHFEWYGVAVGDVIAALRQALE